jgi:hypothetical protein
MREALLCYCPILKRERERERERDEGDYPGTAIHMFCEISG